MDTDGAVVATGTHADLLATSAEYRRVLADISDAHDTKDADHIEDTDDTEAVT
jgi:hypothetical protein